MVDKNGLSGVRQNRLPERLELNDPEAIASFLTHIGYEADEIAAALVSRCGTEPDTAARIVADAALTTQD